MSMADANDPVTPEPPEGSTPEGDEGQANFTEDYVKQLREESKARREAHAPYKEAFEGYSPQEVEWALEQFKSLRGSPEQAAEAAKKFVETGQALLERYGVETPSSSPVGNPTEANPMDEEPLELTQSQLEQMLDAREAQILNRFSDTRIQDQMDAKIASLGYQKDTPPYSVLMGLAAQNGGDMDKAHEAAQSFFKDQAAKLAAEEEEANAAFPSLPTATTNPGQNQKPIKSMDDANAAVKEFLANAGKRIRI